MSRCNEMIAMLLLLSLLLYRVMLDEIVAESFAIFIVEVIAVPRLLLLLLVELILVPS